MGIKGLWEVLAPASEKKISSAYVLEYYKAHGHPCRMGIDASIWFYEFSNALRVGHASSGENPELRSLFFRLAQLFLLPVTLLFVFDGAERPKKKRNKSVKTSEIWIAAAFRNFVKAFGFDYHNAPGEAEAELALLNKMGFIDVILTEDSDAFVFGAQTVLRGGSKIAGNAELYQAAEIQHHPQIGLGPGGFLLMAILCGGDYDTVGLRGCARAIAHKLAQCGFGDNLYRATQEFNEQALQDFLHEWRDQIKAELLTDSRKVLGRQYAALSNHISASFPSVETLKFYVKPLSTQGPFSPDHVVRHLGDRCLDPAQLAWLCCRHFGWSDTSERSIASIFEERIWPGVALRAMTPDITSQPTHPDIYDGLEPVLNEDANIPCAEVATTLSVKIKVSRLHEKMAFGIAKFKSGFVETSEASSPSATLADAAGHASDGVASSVDMVIDVNLPLFIVKSYQNRVSVIPMHSRAEQSRTVAPAAPPATHTPKASSIDSARSEVMEMAREAPSNSPAPVAGSSTNHPIVLSDSYSMSGESLHARNDIDQDVISISSRSLSNSDSSEIIEIIE